ncbi:MAG: type II secretion system F family protein, partial [Deltaproteobacteria bacterium]|nr:type II secretion system F family protein [Deltaproteobacteria bacterium]
MAIELKKEQLNSDKSALSGLQDLLVQKPKITNSDRMFLLEQLTLLLETGIPLYEALSLICEQIVNSTMREMVESLIFDIGDGKSFSYAISKHPEVFSRTHVSLITASENGGFMHEVLEQIMEMEEKREKLRSTLVSAFSYPAFLLFFSCA